MLHIFDNLYLYFSTVLTSGYVDLLQQRAAEVNQHI
jgi:hypothetical protein